ncbi:hypothetical protein SAMN05444481_12318 [Flavobacterium frigidimaris]|jgi:hypothetical protein|nr:hypothetical protein SAMN05444481_12318 [Flavobacterium frigidimaris]
MFLCVKNRDNSLNTIQNATLGHTFIESGK